MRSEKTLHKATYASKRAVCIKPKSKKCTHRTLRTPTEWTVIGWKNHATGQFSSWPTDNKEPVTADKALRHAGGDTDKLTPGGLATEPPSPYFYTHCLECWLSALLATLPCTYVLTFIERGTQTSKQPAWTCVDIWSQICFPVRRSWMIEYV